MYSKILLPLDGSKSAEHALAYGRNLARFEHAEILLLLIYGELWNVGLPNLSAGDLPQGYIDEKMRARQDYLDKVQIQLQADNLTVNTHCYAGDPATEILEIAERDRCDLIVLTRGSVAERVARHSSCPVLIVGPEVQI